MKRLASFFIGFVLTALSAFCQMGKGTVKGTIADGGVKTIESATISLHKIADSSVVKMAVANKDGRYSFENIAEGSYFVSVTAIGHAKAFSPVFTLTAVAPSVDLNKIELQVQAKSLSAVTVTSKKPLIEQKIDRTIINVEASATNVGATALEVLEKSPGITVDKDGNISLKGKDGVIVLIDGRQTYLSGPDLANLLRATGASQLDQIEIMTNPPAKFDASGNSGVINIKTKKNKQLGYNGSISLTYGQGILPKFNEGFNFNYRKNKVNLFTNIGHNYRENSNSLDIQRNFRDDQTKEVITYFDQEARMRNKFNSYNVKLGADYFVTKNTTFGVVLTGFSNPGTFTNRNFTKIYNPPTNLVSQTRAMAIHNQRWQNFSTNINFRHVLDSTGKEITADLDYITYDSKNNQSLVNSYFDATGNATEKSDTLLGSLPQQITIKTGKVDYLHPMKNDARFEAGLKTGFVKTDANAIYDSITKGQVVRDVNRSNHFVYEENINAAYANFSTPLSKKWNAQLGLRVENTNVKGKQITTGETFERNYTQLFPTAYLQYKHNDKNSFVINYGRRIRRPDYQSLNPFINFLDRYTYQQGNPNLKPQLSHNVELTHNFKSIVTTTLNYSYTGDIIQQVIEQNEAKNETYVKQANIAKRVQIGASVNIVTKFAKWHSGNIYVNGFRNKFEGIVGDTSISTTASTLMLNGMQQVNLGKGWSAELHGMYRTRSLEGVVSIKGFGIMGIGITKNILNNNGTIKLTVRDILYSRINRGESRYGSVDMKFREQGDSRVFNVGFTYRFSKGKMGNGPKRRASSATDEQNRVGVGGN